MDGMGIFSPAEITQKNIEIAEKKAAMPVGRMFLLGIMAGVFIAIAAAACDMAAHTASDFAAARLIMSLLFPGGLVLVLLTGGELCTGNMLMTGALCARRITLAGMLRNWGVVYIGNLLGSMIIVLLVFASGMWDASGGSLGAFTIKTAAAKAVLPFGSALAKGVLCNMLVCLAVWCSIAAKTVPGKIMSVFFPICFFVLAGYEHSVANMYYIPAGLFAAAGPNYLSLASQMGVSMEALDLRGFFANQLPVLLGNILGGGMIGVVYWMVFYTKTDKK